jgi:hypothetical protein
MLTLRSVYRSHGAWERFITTKRSTFFLYHWCLAGRSG